MFLNAYINLVTRYFRLIILVLAIITAIFAHFAFKLSIDASSETLLLEDDKDLRLTREVHERYKSLDFLFISFSPKEHLLSQNTIQTLKNLKEELLKIDGVESVVTILDVPLLQSPPMPIKELMSNIKTIESSNIDKDLVQKELTTSPLYANNLVSKDFKTTAIVIYLKEDTKYNKLLKDRNELLQKKKDGNITKEELKRLNEIKKEFKEYRDLARDKTHLLITNIRHTLHSYKNSGELFLGGAMMVADDMIGFVKSDIEIYSSVVLAIMALILWIIFRQVRFVILPLFISFVAVIITTGIYAIFDLEVTVISSNFVSMQLITTLSLVIHLIVSYREYYALYPKVKQVELIEFTLKRMALPSLFVILTTIAGYGSLLTSGILPVMNLGIMMSIGVSISLIVVFLLFPSIMMILGKKEPIFSFDRHFRLTHIFANIAQNHGNKIIVVAIFIAIFSIYGANRLIVENSFINYFKESTEIYKGMKKIDESLGGTTPLEIVVRFPKTEDNLTKNENIDNTLDSFEDEFLASKDSEQYWFTEAKMQKILEIHEYLKSIPQIGSVSSLGTLLELGRIIKDGKNLDNFELAVMYKELPQKYKDIILSPYLNIDKDEVRFVVRIKDSSSDLRRNELIKKIRHDLVYRFNIEPQNFDVVGLMVLYNNMLQSLFSSQILTLGFVVLVLGGMFLILFKSIKVALIAMVVNVTPVSVIFGVMGVFGIPLDMMSITVASIALGMAVDNTIHYYHRFKSELQKDKDYLASMHRSHATIGSAMYFTSLTTAIGFLVLVTSNFIPTVIFGLLVVLTIFMALLADLLLSPLLVVKLKPFG